MEAIRIDATSEESARFSVARPKVYDRLSADDVLGALKRMYLIRRFEEGAEDAYMRGLIHGTMHLSIGQEASAVGTCMPLSDADYITSTHRGHGHCIAKGAEPKLMFAEFFGKENGYCRGRGGSMHIADVPSGNLGANGIVGGRHPDRGRRGAQRSRSGKRDDVGMCLLRRWRHQRRRLPRGAEHGGDLETAGGLRLREQQIRHVDVDRRARWRSPMSPIAPRPMACPASSSTATISRPMAEACVRGDRARARAAKVRR